MLSPRTHSQISRPLSHCPEHMAVSSCCEHTWPLPWEPWQGGGVASGGQIHRHREDYVEVRARKHPGVPSLLHSFMQYSQRVCLVLFTEFIRVTLARVVLLPGVVRSLGDVERDRTCSSPQDRQVGGVGRCSGNREQRGLRQRSGTRRRGCWREMGSRWSLAGGSREGEGQREGVAPREYDAY